MASLNENMFVEFQIDFLNIEIYLMLNDGLDRNSNIYLCIIIATL